MIKELRDINHIIRAFSEVATGAPEEVRVRDISSSDPQFFFGLDPATIAMLAAAVTWALHTWAKVEDIRKARAEVRKINVLTEVEVDKLFDTKIKEHIEAALETKVTELSAQLEKSPRANEQRNDLNWALRSILAHIERGMLVEVRFIPPAAAKAVEAGADAPPASIPETFQKLDLLKRELVFPEQGGAPILQLPQQPGA
jgi:hypothetical protein